MLSRLTPRSWMLAASLLLLPQLSSATIHQINVDDFFFSPLGTVVAPGDTVRWIWVGSILHSSTSTASSPKAWDSGLLSTGATFDVEFTAADPDGPYPYVCTIHPAMVDTIWVQSPTTSCCGEFTGGFTGNTDCDSQGKRNLADITRLIDRVYITKSALCCEENGNVDGDPQAKINLADITRLIDHVYLSKAETEPCL